MKKPVSINKIIVQKYGGSSLSSPRKIREVSSLIAKKKDEGNSLVIIVSAMGKSTDELVSLIGEVADKNIPDPREMDILLSTGEIVSSTLMAIALKSKGYDAVSLNGTQAGITTDSSHGAARIRDINPDRIRNELAFGRIVIIAGFQGRSETGEVTTLGRGGSDTSAVAVAVALEAEQCEIYTDVQGIYTTDPAITDAARKLDVINFEEMLEMASLGAKMNPRSIELAALYDMPLYVASTFSRVNGTFIHGDTKIMEERKAVTGIAVDRNVSKISVLGVMDRPGVAAELLKPLSESGISVDVIVQNTSVDGTTDFTFTVDESVLDQAYQLMKNQNNIIFNDVIAGRGLAKISVVGTGMQNTPGYASLMFETLADEGINIDMITTSEIRITTIIDKNSVDQAVQSLHKSFNLEKPD
ncbi:MAG: aspartate kinase [SAR202 cluster bacterium]|jgi:aspartate kinase|nr:aspartate kinase [Chloroflexota bacterium]MDP7232498.1 aspartate kinase [Dehalococcoidia bacterium]MQG47180.1 aspartate kinase [SAR202 cluster bacterium]